MKQLKGVIILVMVVQVILMCVGILQLSAHHIGIGLFNLIVNLVFFFVNVNTLKRIKNSDQENNPFL